MSAQSPSRWRLKTRINRTLRYCPGVGRHPSRTRTEVIEAAIELVERDGLEALSLRDLGAALGVGHTSVYTHFKDKHDLILALVAHVAGDAVPLDIPESTGPRTRLCFMAKGVRALFARYPRLAPALLQAAGSEHSTPDFSRAVIAEIARAGLGGRRLIVAFRTLESYLMGASVFDFGGAPEHLSSRAARQLAIDPALFASTSTESAVAELNDEAFMAGFELLLDGFGIQDD